MAGPPSAQAALDGDPGPDPESGPESGRETGRETVAGGLLVTFGQPPGEVPVAVATSPDVGWAKMLTERVMLVRSAPRSDPGAVDRVAEAVRGLADVIAVEPEGVRRLADDGDPDDPRFAEQWAHEQTRIDGLWARTTGRRDVRVAIIDSGIVATHPDLEGNVVEQVVTADGVVRPGPAGGDNDTCGLGHGTAIAGVIGAIGDNGLGVAGVAWRVGIIDIAVNADHDSQSCDGISDGAVIAAIDYATTHPDGPVDVINLSLGAPQSYCPEAYATVISAARAAGVAVVASAGNNRVGFVHVPASCPGVISVGATEPSGQLAPYSAANRWVEIAAPGGSDEPEGRILTTSRDGSFELRRGTSFAAAYVSGVTALLRALHPDSSPDDLAAVLARTAEREGDERVDGLGWGVVRADRAAAYLQRRDEVEPMEPPPFFPVYRLQPPPSGPAPIRIAATERQGADPNGQAIAVSRALFRSAGAVHAVFARQDDFPDALAGSAVTLGLGPLFFASTDGDIPSAVRRELRRVLPEGGRVYLLGGTATLPETVRLRLRGLGYETVRLAGPSRDETAVAVARQVVQQRRELGLDPPGTVLLVSNRDWPDAVAAGTLAARFGFPVLLTSPRRLHLATRAFLEELQPDTILVVGGLSRVSNAVATRAGSAADGATVERLRGPNRVESSLAVARKALEISDPMFGIAVNFRQEQGFTHALVASALAGAHSGVLLPIEGEDGDELPEAVADLVASEQLIPIVLGDSSLVSDRVADLLAELAGSGA